MKILLPLLLLAAMPAQAQKGVRLQLFDHVVGTEILHNKVLPAGTEVWVVTKPEARAMRLREGYDEVVQAMATATRDRVGQNGYTEKSYPGTESARRSYFVIARLPDGRLFQSYVRTGDAGMQPGFDAVQSGRISMGEAPAAARTRLAASLTGTVPTPPATTNPPKTGEVEAPPETAEALDPSAPLELPAGLDLPGFPDTSLFLSDSAISAPRPVPMQEVEEVPEVAPAAREGRGGSWLWFLLGFAAGGAAAYFAAATYYERLLRRQRENLLRYVPMPPGEAVSGEAVSGEADVEPEGEPHGDDGVA